jgi:murein DD-endopeptidase MepM/ murein hydrolase activator NlpD
VERRRRPAGWQALAALLLACVGALAGARPADAAGWSWPLEGTGPAGVTRGFDPPASRYGAGHRGVDLAGATGAAVLAAGEGVVSFSGVIAGRGVLVVAHGALRTTYEPVGDRLPAGSTVRSGDPVGRLDAGHPGCAAAACLHWGLKRGEEYLDPLSLLGPAAVRLLPLGGATSGPPPDPVSAGPPPLLRTGADGPPRGEGSPPAGAAVPVDPGQARAVGAGWVPRSARASTGLVALGLLALAALASRRGPPRRPGGGAAEPPARPALQAVPGDAAPRQAVVPDRQGRLAA